MQYLQKYKKTELGEIPEEWEIKNLSNLGEIITGNTPSTTNKQYYGNDYLWASPIDLGYSKYIKETQNMLSIKGFQQVRKILPKSILVVCIGSTIGKVGIALKEMSTNQQINSIMCKDNIDNEYLYYQLLKNQKKIKDSANQLAVPIINKNNFGLLKISIPKSLKEQQKIASILSNVDELIQKTEQIIEQTQKLKKGLIQRLLTKGIGHIKFKKVALSRLNMSNMIQIPYEWEVKRLKDIAVINPESINEKYSYTEINYIEIGAIRNYEIQEYVVHNLSKRPSRAQRVIRKGDIIVSTVRPYLRGFTLITDSRPNLICSTGFAVIRPKNNHDENFIFNYIKSKLFEDNIFRSMEGMAYPAITSSDVANSIIPYPKDKKEMMKIGSLLYNIDSSIRLKYSYKLKLGILKKGLMQQLLTGKIRVKV